MMVLVMHTEDDDTVLHTKKTGMWMLVVKIDVGGMTIDVVNKWTCSSNDGFGVDAAMMIKEKHQVFTAASEDISAVWIW
nr:hypothetical protein [Tanacetum cinerariifolium]